MQGSGKARGEGVRRLREAKPWTQAQLATASGVSTRTIMRVEAGEETSAETVMALCAALDVSVADLAGWEDPEKPVAIELAGEVSSAATVPDPRPDRDVDARGGTTCENAAPSRLRSWMGLAEKGLVASLALVGLASIGLAAGTHAAWQATIPHRPYADEGFKGKISTFLARKLNLLSVRYSSNLADDAPERSWDPWRDTLHYSWDTCGRLGRGIDGGYQEILLGWFPMMQKLDTCGVARAEILVTRLDDEATEATVGPLESRHLRNIAGALTGDPSVRVEVMWAPDRDAYPIRAAWIDPRVEALPLQDDKYLLKVRFARSGR